MWFYVGMMLVMIIGNALQLKNSKRIFLNWVQIVIAVGTLVWFVYMIFNGLSSYFYFVTTVAFWTSLVIEIWQIAKRQEKAKFGDIIFTFLSAIVPLFSTAILSGLI